MRAFRQALILLAACGCVAPVFATSEVARDELLQSAQLWEVRYRNDLAAAAYEKMLLINPADTQALLALGLLNIRDNKMDMAQKQALRLQKLQPQSRAAQQLADAYRVATRDRLKMATLRRLYDTPTTRSEDLLKTLRELFPNGAPPAELGLEYYKIIGSSPAGWNEARAGLAQLVKENPVDPRYRMALARFLLRKEETRAESLRILAALSRDVNADPIEVADIRTRAQQSRATKVGTTSVYDRAQRLQTESETALTQGQQGLALKKQEAAVDLLPTDPWVRFKLAKLYIQFGVPGQARSLMQEGVERVPKDTGMRYAQALVLSSLDDDESALTSLSNIPAIKRSEAMNTLESRLQISVWRKQAVQLAADGDSAGAERLLQAAEGRAGNNPDWVTAIAYSWMIIGQPARANALMSQRLGEPEQTQGTTLLVWAEMLDRQADDARLGPALSRLQQDASLSKDGQQTVGRLQQNLLERRADAFLRRMDALREAGRNAEALAELEDALRAAPDDARLLEARADVLAGQGDHAQAAAVYRGLIARKPDDLNLKLAYARSLRGAGQRVAASQQLDEVQRRVAPDAVGTRKWLAQQRLSLDQVPAARSLVQDLLKQAPQDPSLLVLAGRIESAERNYELALDYFRRAADAEKRLPVRLASGQTQTAAEEELDRLERRRYEGFITAGLNPRDKPGDPGVSQFNQLEIPIEMVVPVGYDARAFAHLDTVHLSAGTLPAVYNDAAFYGKVQAFGPASLANFPNGADQKATGAAIGVGYETDKLRLDLGTTPIGFPVVDIVGGIKYSSSWGATDYSLDLSRRPITSSLLSYAGAHDPVTGEVWGGVRTSGLEARVARDFGRLGTSLSVGYHLLNGRNVASNDFLSARAATDWLFIDRDDTRLTAGLALTHWRYAKNLSGYTFGQGGYYSPQTYTALALPIDLRGRIGRWSYRLRPSLSYSRSTTQDSPFYPTDAGLQSMAASSPLPPGYTRPVFDGGSGSGVGYAFKGALEYQLLPDYFIGAAYDLDRSDFYSPNSTVLYVRHMFQDWKREVPFPPRPPKSYADF